jgi:cytochrome c oxidase cbb3-type subunit 3
MNRITKTAALVTTVVLLSACEREKRDFQASAPPEKSPPNSMSDLHPGGGSQTPVPQNSFDENAYAVSQGQQLFSAFNCVGCHAHGGGGMGPALMDNKWLYGSTPQQIFPRQDSRRPGLAARRLRSQCRRARDKRRCSRA